MKHIVSLAVVLAALSVGSYVVTLVKRSISASYTHLGFDTICLVWVATGSLLALGTFSWARGARFEKTKLIPLLSVIVPTVVLLAWAWLVVTDRVISHAAMMEPK